MLAERLAHEAFHRAGVVDEAAAECFGLQKLSETAQELGAARAQADGLAPPRVEEL